MLGRMSKWDEPDAWDTFDPQAYFHDNYSTVGEEDAAILTRLRDFLASRLHPGSALEVLDVGTGTNLYPVLAALPYAQTVHLLEFGEQNRRWLDQQVAQLGTSWDPFVEILRVKPDHARVDHRRLLSHIGSVESGSLHELPRQACDIGLMFFVAESVTDDRSVFRAGVGRFVESVRPGGLFASAFMLGSDGYSVGGKPFPAVSLALDDLEEAFASTTAEVVIESVPLASVPVRSGYHKMATAMGRRL